MGNRCCHPLYAKDSKNHKPVYVTTLNHSFQEANQIWKENSIEIDMECKNRK